MEPVPAKRKRGRPKTHGLSGDPLYESIIKPILRRGLVAPEWRDPRTFYDAVLAEVGPRPSGRHVLVPTSGSVFRPGDISWHDRGLDRQAKAVARRRECECPEVEVATCQCSYAAARRQHALSAVVYEDDPDLDLLGLALSSLTAEQHRPSAALQALVDGLIARKPGSAASAFEACESCDCVLCTFVGACERQVFG